MAHLPENGRVLQGERGECRREGKGLRRGIESGGHEEEQRGCCVGGPVSQGQGKVEAAPWRRNRSRSQPRPSGPEHGRPASFKTELWGTSILAKLSSETRQASLKSANLLILLDPSMRFEPAIYSFGFIIENPTRRPFVGGPRLVPLCKGVRTWMSSTGSNPHRFGIRSFTSSKMSCRTSSGSSFWTKKSLSSPSAGLEKGRTPC